MILVSLLGINKIVCKVKISACLDAVDKDYPRKSMHYLANMNQSIQDDTATVALDIFVADMLKFFICPLLLVYFTAESISCLLVLLLLQYRIMEPRAIHILSYQRVIISNQRLLMT